MIWCIRKDPWAVQYVFQNYFQKFLLYQAICWRYLPWDHSKDSKFFEFYAETPFFNQRPFLLVKFWPYPTSDRADIRLVQKPMIPCSDWRKPLVAVVHHGRQGHAVTFIGRDPILFSKTAMDQTIQKIRHWLKFPKAGSRMIPKGFISKMWINR